MVPLIKAPKGPYKVRPEIPGGMEILNKDMDIYNVLENRPEKPSTERLTSAPSDITSLTQDLRELQKFMALKIGLSITSNIFSKAYFCSIIVFLIEIIFLL